MLTSDPSLFAGKPFLQVLELVFQLQFFIFTFPNSGAKVKWGIEHTHAISSLMQILFYHLKFNHSFCPIKHYIELISANHILNIEFILVSYKHTHTDKYISNANNNVRIRSFYLYCIGFAVAVWLRYNYNIYICLYHQGYIPTRDNNKQLFISWIYNFAHT